MSAPACVITSIGEPSKGVRKLETLFPGSLIVIGDKKSPPRSRWSASKARFYSVGDQALLPYKLVYRLPYGHYARKNIGYLEAIADGATLIYDTDDDNIPNEAWKMRDVTCKSRMASESGWCNAYKFFHPSNIWPRGFSLKHLKALPEITKTSGSVYSPIQQGLADGDPDVDAIWRLALQQDVVFGKKLSVTLPPKTWCPFNSQSTWWWPEAYPLLYLPVNVSFRMTDIWRSFVAQRCLWGLGLAVTFHSPAEVYQERNPHDLIKDFKDEIPGYLNNHTIVDILGNLNLDISRGLVENLYSCYEALVSADLIIKDELRLVEAWSRDLGSVLP